jgi:hypothetical protein
MKRENFGDVEVDGKIILKLILINRLYVYWIYLTFVKMAMKLQISQKAGNFLTVQIIGDV